VAIIGAVSGSLLSSSANYSKRFAKREKAKVQPQVKVLETTSDVALRIAEMTSRNARIYSKECIGSEK